MTGFRGFFARGRAGVAAVAGRVFFFVAFFFAAAAALVAGAAGRLAGDLAAAVRRVPVVVPEGRRADLAAGFRAGVALAAVFRGGCTDLAVRARDLAGAAGRGVLRAGRRVALAAPDFFALAVRPGAGRDRGGRAFEDVERRFWRALRAAMAAFPLRWVDRSA